MTVFLWVVPRVTSCPRFPALPQEIWRTAKRRVFPGSSPGTTTQSPDVSDRLTGGPVATTMPPGAASLAASGISSFTSPAQRMTTASNGPQGSLARSSRRSETTRAPFSPSSRTAVARNDARRRRDSARVTSRSPRTISPPCTGAPSAARRRRSSSARRAIGWSASGTRAHRWRCCSTHSTAYTSPCRET